MSLVQYLDSDSETDDKSHAGPAQSSQPSSKTAVKRKLDDSVNDSLPPLPAAFHDLYSTNARVSTSDNPSLHGGRKRAIPHVEGNWPSHIYLEWIPSQTESSDLHNLIQHVRDVIEQSNRTRAKKLPVPKIAPSLQSELGAPLPLHVSLSRTLQLKTEDREDFLAKLKSSLRRAAVRSFQVEFESIKWVPNFERNRWFLVLGIVKPAHDELNRLLVACNEATVKAGFPGLYTGGHGDGPMEKNNEDHTAKRRKSEIIEDEVCDRSDYFHISIAWNLEEPNAEWVTLIQEIDVRKHVQSPQGVIDTVKARIGNIVHSIDLGKSRAKVL